MNDVIFGNQRDVMSKKPKCRRYRHMSARKVAPASVLCVIPGETLNLVKRD